MIHRIGRRNFDIYAMEIESHNDAESIAKRETSIWLGALINSESSPDDPQSYFYTIDEFLNKARTLSSRKRGHGAARRCKNVAIYVYDLSFEWSFILPVLLDNGFEFRAEIRPDDTMVYNSVSSKSASSVWQVQIKYATEDGVILLRDLSKMYPGGLKEVAEACGTEVRECDIDYTLNRLHGHVVTDAERQACFNSAKMVCDILDKEAESGDPDFFKAASMATYSMAKLLRSGYPRSERPYAAFRRDYPALSAKESEFVRNALSGGLCYATKAYQFKEITVPVLHIDAHQMYPSQVYMRLHPYGYGEYFKGEPTQRFKRANCCHVRVSYNDVKLHSVVALIGQPFIDGRELWLWDFEIPTMRKCYEGLEIEYIDGYSYAVKPLPWRNYVNANYEARKAAKARGDGYESLRRKLMNNAGAYGKFVEKVHNSININYINEYGIIDSRVVPKEEQRANAKYSYVPLSTIPAWGRVCLIETALKLGWQNILYFDTDSIFCLWNEETQKAWGEINQKDELGGWELVEISERSQFAAPKRYKTESQGKTTIKAGGINFEYYKEHTHEEEIKYLLSTGLSKDEAVGALDIPFDEVNIVSSRWKVKRAYRVRGGTIIEFQERSMRVSDKHLGAYLRNAASEKRPVERESASSAIPLGGSAQTASERPVALFRGTPGPKEVSI